MRNLFLIVISILLFTSCGSNNDRLVRDAGGYTQSDLDRQYIIGYERGNKQGYEAGYDSGYSRVSYNYSAPKYRAGSGFNVYVSPRNGGGGYSSNYGYSKRKTTTTKKAIKNNISDRTSKTKSNGTKVYRTSGVKSVTAKRVRTKPIVKKKPVIKIRKKSVHKTVKAKRRRRKK